MSDKIKESKIKSIFFAADMENDGDFIPLISDDEDDVDIKKSELPKELPILPLRNTVLFPGVILPITVGREKSIRLVNDIYKKDKMIGTVAQIDPNVNEPEEEDMHRLGTVAHILKVLEMPDGSTSVIIQGRQRFEMNQMVQADPYHKATVTLLKDKKPSNKTREFEAIVGSLKDLSLSIIRLSNNIPPEASFAVKNIENTKFLVNFMCSNSDIDVKDKQKLLEIDNIKERSIRLLEHLSKQIQMLELKNDIQSKVKTDLDRQQREYLLNQQMKTIQDELGGNPMDLEIEDLKKKAEDKKWSKEVAEIFTKEISKLNRLNPATGEYSVQLNYLQTILDLPWNEFTDDNFDLKRAQKVLDEDHFGLENVKDRII